MTPEAAAAKATELNRTGKHREAWFYYPTIHNEHMTWFVMRRKKSAAVKVAVFISGSMAPDERT